MKEKERKLNLHVKKSHKKRERISALVSVFRKALRISENQHLASIQRTHYHEKSKKNFDARFRRKPRKQVISSNDRKILLVCCWRGRGGEGGGEEGRKWGSNLLVCTALS